jgi:hypothetical protein
MVEERKEMGFLVIYTRMDVIGETAQTRRMHSIP